MSQSIYKILFWSGQVYHFPLLFIYFITYRHFNKAFKTLTYLAIVSALCDLCCYYLARQHRNTHPIFHIYNVFEAALLCLFYLQVLQRKLFKKMVYVGAVIIFLSIIISFFEPGAIYKVNDLVSFIQCLILTIFAMLYFIQMLDLLEEPSLSQSPMFWMNAGILIYSALPSLMFLFYRIDQHDAVKRIYSWMIFMCCSTIFYTFQFISVWKYRKKHL